MTCILTPITAREFPGHCTAGKPMEFEDEVQARKYARDNKIHEFMISWNAKPMVEGQRFNIATL